MRWNASVGFRDDDSLVITTGTAKGPQRLLEMQDDFQGFWMGAGSMESQEIATSFALLFLSKGKRQVVIGRLKYPDQRAAGDWQQHPDSLRQLVRHVEYHGVAI